MDSRHTPNTTATVSQSVGHNDTVNIDQLTAMLGWAAVINIVVLVVSTVVLLAKRRRITALHARLFGLDEKDLGLAYFQYLAQFKIATIVVSIAPYLALRIIA